MPKIIGIGGCSRSGKSSLAQKIKERLQEKRVLLLDMDDFVLPESRIPRIKDRVDWERPESVNFEGLIQTIKDHQASYDIIVVEGILIFANDELLRLFDTTVHIQISKQTFLKRRQKETRWGNEPDWFISHVWDAYLKYGQLGTADFTLSGEESIPNFMVDSIIKKN